MAGPELNKIKLLHGLMTHHVRNPFAVQQYHFTYKTLATRKVSMLDALFKTVKNRYGSETKGITLEN
jgi:hypothetical protein